jgi:hypothetical protein
MRERIALGLLGGWVIGTLILFTVAPSNFHTVDKILRESTDSVFRAEVAGVGEPAARQMLRYLASELNRLFFGLWNIAQVGLGLGVAWSLARLPDARRARQMLWAMLLLVALMLFWLTPEITSLGRRLDFMPRDPAPPELSRFRLLHALYTAADLAKLGLAFALLVTLVRRSPATDSPLRPTSTS